jgi:hypothetical protein
MFIVIPFLVKGTFNIKGFIAGGGIGPGSYYPWVYLQLWILMPFMYFLMEKSPIAGVIIILIISVMCDIVFSIFLPKEFIYRLCASRYLFIFVLAYLITYKNIPYKYILIFAIAGAGFVFAHVYKGINFEPIFFNAWQADRFPNYFYTLIIFMFLYKIYEYIPKNIGKIICRIGYHSWEIFLIQMIYFTFNVSLNISWGVNVFLSLFICIVPVCTYEFMKRPMEISGEHVRSAYTASH